MPAPKRIVITGVSRGLGKALVDGFVARGHVVFGCARSAKALAELRRRYPQPNGFSVVDVTNDDEVQAWAAEVLPDGPPDLLVNNAATIDRNAPLWKVPADEFSQVIDANIKGVVNVIRHFLPAMVERGNGVVVNFSSWWGREGAAEVAPYCATKWAVEGLTRALAAELPSGMAAVPVIPGIIDTEMLRSCFGADAANYPEPATWAEKAVPFLLSLGPKDNGKPDMALILLGDDGKPFTEAQQVMVENNLFIHNSPVRTWDTLLYKGGLKDITFRANTVVGHPAVKWSGAEAVVCLRIEKNPPMGDLVFANNIFCDPTGEMPRLAIAGAKTFASGSKQVLLNNLYWNAGKKVPAEPQDVLAPGRDAKKILADPRLGDWAAGKSAGGAATRPRWDAKRGNFLSGQKTIREEFERLARLCAVPAAGSPAIHAAYATDTPKDDILGHPRGQRPDLGCVESGTWR
jgi:NAD(P)-dependent dehydrogenase (short-subunit alcohol dehydrogenase family)